MSLLPTKVSDLVDLLNLIPHPEGGFFLETFRSGSVPMSSRGQTDLQASDYDLVVRKNDNGNNLYRNALTSIYWTPTTKTPVLKVVHNKSDHVHYYQGGRPFVYYIYEPSSQEIKKTILGPDLKAGHVMQFGLPGNIYKWGHLVGDSECHEQLKAFDYSLIAEAVAPGFDVADFDMVGVDKIKSLPQHIQDEMLPFVHDHDKGDGDSDIKQDFDSFYDDNDKRSMRASERK